MNDGYVNFSAKHNGPWAGCGRAVGAFKHKLYCLVPEEICLEGIPVTIGRIDHGHVEVSGILPAILSMQRSLSGRSMKKRTTATSGNSFVAIRGADYVHK